MRVRWTRLALADLAAIGARVSADDPAAAARLGGEIEDAVTLLGRHQALGRPGRVPDTRELVVPETPYLVPYRVRGGEVHVLRVLHGARRWPRSF